MVAALTILAGIALLVSGACLAIFFATGSDPWGRANDATVAAWALLMIPSALELSSRYAGRSWAVVLVTALAVAGDLVIASTSGASETRSPPRSTTAVWIAAFLCLPTWCIWLGISLPGGG